MRASRSTLPFGVFTADFVNDTVERFAVNMGLFALFLWGLAVASSHSGPGKWRDVILGGIATSLLFTVGKLVLALYLGKASFASTYGAFASVVVLVLWVYYSGQIFFFGAELTKSFANRFGSHPSLHPGRLVVPASEEEARRVFGFEKIDVIVAMGLAGLVNMAMLFMAARVFHESGHADVATISSAYETLTPLLGGTAAVVFGISLVTSGVASSHVGTMAGQVVMQGFVNFRIGIWLRRILTMIPALVAIYLGLDPTRTLVISQVVLSFTLPFPVNVIASMLGLPRADLPQFHRWAIELISVSFDWERGTQASCPTRSCTPGTASTAAPPTFSPPITNSR